MGFKKLLTLNCSIFFTYQLYQRIKQRRHLILPRLWNTVRYGFLPVAYAFGTTKQMDNDAHIIHRADELYTNNDIDGLYTYLSKYKDSNNDQLLWRLARACCDKAKDIEDKNQKRLLIFLAFDYAGRALELNDKNFACHKWYAILLDSTGEYEGIKKRIENSFLVKEHFLKARELNPKDATTIYSLGFWCFLFADMPWYQQKIASVAFATPPSSTYTEALKYFLEAEKSDPNFYSMNLLMLGKTFLRMKNTRSAIEYLTRARDYPQKHPDDKQARTEAIYLLKTLGISSEET